MNSLNMCFVQAPLLAALYTGSMTSWGWGLEEEEGEARAQPETQSRGIGLAAEGGGTRGVNGERRAYPAGQEGRSRSVTGLCTCAEGTVGELRLGT